MLAASNSSISPWKRDELSAFFQLKPRPRASCELNQNHSNVFHAAYFSRQLSALEAQVKHICSTHSSHSLLNGFEFIKFPHVSGEAKGSKVEG